MLGEPAVVLTAGTSIDPDSGETLKDWAHPTETPVGDVLVDWLPAQPLLTVTGAVTTRATVYFRSVPLVPLVGARIRIRGVVYAVLGEPLNWRIGLEVPVIDLLTANRSAAEDLMVDTCTVEHPTGSTVVAGVETVTYATLYTGRCRVQSVGAGSQVLRDVGDQQVSVLSIQVQLPITGSEGIHVRDRITILRATNDSDLVGRVFTVSQPAPSSDAVARLLPCVEVTG